MLMAQEEPLRLKSEVEKAKQVIHAESDSLSAKVDGAAQMSLSWRDFEIEREKVEEQFNHARYEYKTVLKRTESAALSGQPRLYWFAKSMFAQLRKHSLEYQVFEAKTKLEALEASYSRLLGLVKNLRLDVKTALSQVVDDAVAKDRSHEHAQTMNEMWERHRSAVTDYENLQRKTTEVDIASANSSAVFAGMPNSRLAEYSKPTPAIVHSEKMLTSQLAHVGFINKSKLMGLIEQSEFAAEHAERDLQKIRDGLRTAAEAAVDGRATRMSREWVEYCKGIVCRYFEHGTDSSTSR